MKLQKLNLLHFRNHENSFFEFKSDLTLVVGQNTSGKTNLLDSLSVLSFGKSRLAAKEEENISFNQNHCFIKAQIEKNNEPLSLQVIYFSNPKSHYLQKKYLVNGVAKTHNSFVGNFLSVTFFPEDLTIASGSPSKRRSFLNEFIAQADPRYRAALSLYEKTVRARNAILEKIKNGQGRRQELAYWNKIAIENGQYLTAKREKFVEFLNDTDNTNTFPLNIITSYDKSVISEERLNQYAQAEVAVSSTLVGPHHDDLFFFDNKRNLKTFGSRGEQRLLVLFLKLKAVEFLQTSCREKPVILLDDIFSELDDSNREVVAHLVTGHQTIITTANEQEAEKINSLGVKLNFIKIRL